MSRPLKIRFQIFIPQGKKFRDALDRFVQLTYQPGRSSGLLEQCAGIIGYSRKQIRYAGGYMRTVLNSLLKVAGSIPR